MTKAIEIEWIVQSSPDHVVHLVADRLFDRTPDLIGLSNDDLRSYPPVEDSSDGQWLISPGFS